MREISKDEKVIQMNDETREFRYQIQSKGKMMEYKSAEYCRDVIHEMVNDIDSPWLLDLIMHTIQQLLPATDLKTGSRNNCESLQS